MHATTRRIRGAIPLALAEDLGLSVGELRRLAQLGWLPPMAGGAEDDDQSDDANENDQDDEQDTDTSARGDESDTDDQDDDDQVRLSKAEAERLRKIEREHNKAEAKRRKDERARREKDGEYQALLEEERREKESEIEKRDLRIAELEADAQNRKQRDIAEKVAKRLFFKDPEDLWLRVAGSEAADDEQRLERRAKQLLKDRPDLKDERAATGASMNGNSANRVPADAPPRQRLTAAYDNAA